MKIFKIILISFLVIIVLVAVAAVIVIKTFDINKFKPQIVEQATNALARPVDFQNAQLAAGLHGISLQLNGLTIAEDPAFGRGNFLEVQGISVGVDIIGYILKRQISITGILINSPEVTIIRTKDGAINAQTIAKSSGTGQPAVSASAAAANGSGATGLRPAAFALPALLISSLKGQNGRIKYIDQSFTPAITLEVTNVSFQINRLSLSDPFPFYCQAAVLSTQQNIKIEGKCQLDLKNIAVKIIDLKVTSDLSRLILAQIPRAIPMVPAQTIPAELKGTFNATTPELVANAKGIATMNIGASLTDGLVKFKEMAVPVGSIAAENTITEKDILVNSFSAAIGQGAIKGSGWLKNYLTGQDYNFEVDAEKLHIADLVAPGQMPVNVEGIISAKGKVKGHSFVPEALRDNLVGSATVDVTGGRVKGINVLSLVLDKLSVIPGLGESLKSNLPDTYKQKLEQKDTLLSDFTIPVTVVNGRVFIGDMTISSEDLFTFKAKGDAGFDGAYSLEGAALISQGLSKALIASAKPMQYLCNEEQMIYIPLKVSGAAGATMQVTVDSGYITKKLIENQARQQISKGLDRLFGSGQPESQPGAQDQGQSAQQPQSQNSDRATVEQKVNKLLQGIFK